MYEFLHRVGQKRPWCHVGYDVWFAREQTSLDGRQGAIPVIAVIRVTEFMELLLPTFCRLSHSGLIPASLMIGPHISVSDASRAASSAGVDAVTGAPMASYLSLTEGCSSAATASARILVAISFGVFACTNNPHQGDTSNPGIDSAIAGISGAAGERFGEVTAMPRMVLFWCWDMTPGRLLNIASTRPGMRSFMASAAPR